MNVGRVWQAMPQGWIEFVAQGASEREAWWDDYLSSGAGWLPDESRGALSAGYRAGCDFFAGREFDFAGVALAPGEHPFVSFLATQVLRETPERPYTSALHATLPLVRFGDDAQSEPFLTEDGRTGTVTTGIVNEGGAVASIGEVRLPERDGNVIVFGLCTDPLRRDFLALHTAFALTTTRILPDGRKPVRPIDELPSESTA